MKEIRKNAKLWMWAEDPRVVALPRVVGLPDFPPQRFSSYTEMNAWKSRYLDRIARAGGVQWMKSSNK